MKTKIVWHYPHLRFWMGGTKHVCELISIFNKRKDTRASLICNLGVPSVIKKFTDISTPVITTSKYCTNDFLYWLFFPIFLAYDSIKSFPFLKESDVILATVFPSNLICAICSILLKRKYYYYCFEPFPFFHNKDLIKEQPVLKNLEFKTLSFLYGWLDIWATQRASKIFTSDPPKQDLIRQIYNMPAIISPVGVDTKVFKQYPNNKIKDRYSDRVIITHATDYTPLKRTDLVIKAMKYLVKEYPRVLLLITSTRPNSPEKKIYSNLIKKFSLKDNVVLLDFVPHEDIPLYYSSSVCYVSASYNQMTCTNLPVKEACSCATPIIRAPVPGEVDITNNISGFIVNTKKPKLIANKIKYFIQNPEKAKKMGLEAQKAIRDKFTWEKGAEIVLNGIFNK
jgi:glycosyltransferase involved in cell wall biosynthesis